MAVWRDDLVADRRDRSSDEEQESKNRRRRRTLIYWITVLSQKNGRSDDSKYVAYKLQANKITLTTEGR